MATEEQVALVLEYLEKVKPADFFKTFNDISVGSGAVLRYLFETGGEVTAGNISDFMHVSTARVAVLIKKMVLQGLVTKESRADDARITVVHITPAGEEQIRRMRDEMFSQVSKVIDKVGMERVMEFLTTFEE
ncbi:MAG: MarR family winged helix-turn-helix transcriptional regulator, partial [Firmicutes bacterium]|nr:MarR family winged helix-turn-helix transcriptional regulator [Bacillota bacterium]